MAGRGTRGLKLLAAVICLGLSGPLAGCHHARAVSQTDEITTALNQFYQGTPVCLWQKSITLDATRNPSESMTHAQAHALIGSGLLVAEGRHYTLTGGGMPFWRPDPKEPRFGNLCFGTWRVTRIERMKTSHDLFGDVVQTEFNAIVPSAASWTQLPQVQEAFPLMALEISHDLPHVVMMRRTDKGWQIASAVVGSTLSPH